jgi:DNA-binding MarR family transcriptional regulator
MTIEFLALSKVREVLFALSFGDRFEKDLISKFDDEGTYTEIRDRLLKENLIYRFLGENNAPYLSLTDKGFAIVSRLDEIERILSNEEIGSM